MNPTYSERADVRFEAMFRRHDAIMLLVEPETGGILDANDSALNFYGWNHATLIAMYIDAINQLHPDHVAALRATAVNSGAVRFIAPHRLASGEIRSVEVHSSPMPDGSLLSIIHDVSDRIRSERELRELAATLEQQVQERTRQLAAEKLRAEAANRAKSEFLTNMSHELRSPLHSILGFTKLLEDDSPDLNQADAGRMLMRIRQGAETLLHLVNDLLDSARIETGGFALDHAPIDLVQIVESVLPEFATAANEKRIRIEPRLPDSAPLRGDPLRLGQALRNVIANALRFAPDATRIELQVTAPDAAHWQISIADQGPGIPATEIDSIFERFTQSSRTKTGSGGTGLGLPITRGIITLHGGHVWAENRAERGAVFHIRLPVEALA